MSRWSDYISNIEREFSNNISKLIDGGAMREAARAAMFDSSAIRAALGPQISLPSISDAVLGLSYHTAADRLARLYSDFGATSRALDAASRLSYDSVSKTIAAFNEQNRKVLDGLAVNSYSGIVQEIQRAQQDYFHTLNRSMATNAEAVYAQLSRLDDIFPRFFGGSLAAILDTPVEEIDEQDIGDMLSSLEEFFEDRGGKSLRSYISFQDAMSILSLALTVIFFLMSTASSNKSTDEINKRISESEKKIIATIERLLPEKNDEAETIYIVQRQVIMRVKPTNKSATIALLYPNQIVALCSNRGKWIYVRYFDFIEGIDKTGWVLKKYLIGRDRSK